MKTIDTSLLKIAYEELNPTGKRCVILLHGWPDSPRTWKGVAPELAKQGWRVLVPALRGFSPTEFLKTETPRTGQLASLGRDLVEFIEALGIEKPALVGHDWGARAAGNACGLSPDIASRLVLLSVGYGTNLPSQHIDFLQARNYWYHWLMATSKGAELVKNNPREFAKVMWDTWSPAGWYNNEEFELTAQAFDNPDWLAVTLHSYSHRWGHAPSDPYYANDEAALLQIPKITIPTLMLHGVEDSVSLPKTSEGKEHLFSGYYERKLLPKIGHFPQRENPDLIARELIEFLDRH